MRVYTVVERARKERASEREAKVPRRASGARLLLIKAGSQYPC